MDSYGVKAEDIFIAPYPEEEAMRRLGETTVQSMFEYMRVVAKEQVAWAKRTGQVGPIGGRLLVAEIKRREIAIRDLGNI